MQSLYTDKRWHERALEITTKIESSSSVEVVVVGQDFSGSYRDCRLSIAILASWITMGTVVLVPWEIHDYLLLPLAAVGFLMGWLASGSWDMVRRFASKERRKQQVEDAAKVAFHSQNVRATKDRTGLLVFFSDFEQMAYVIADYGIQAQLSDSVWQPINQPSNPEKNPQVGHKSWADNYFDELEKIQPRLAEALPRAADDVNELPDAPQVLVGGSM